MRPSPDRERGGFPSTDPKASTAVAAMTIRKRGEPMEKVTTKKELRVTAENRLGILAEVTGLVAAQGVNIENVCAYVSEKKAILHLITNDNEKAIRALGGRGYHIEEDEVIVLLLWNRPGALSEVAAMFKNKGLDLQYVYGTTSPEGAAMTVVFYPDDDHKAMESFETMILQSAEHWL
jgi:hypothetical protein